jgi:hypothetical protein
VTSFIQMDYEFDRDYESDDSSHEPTYQELAEYAYQDDKLSQFCTFKKYESCGIRIFREDEMDWLLFDKSIDSISLFVMDPPTKRQTDKLSYCHVYTTYKNKCKKDYNPVTSRRLICGAPYCCNVRSCCSTAVYIRAQWIDDYDKHLTTMSATYEFPGCISLSLTNSPYNSSFCYTCLCCGWRHPFNSISSLDDFDAVGREVLYHCKYHAKPNWKKIGRILASGLQRRIGADSPIKFLSRFLLNDIMRFASASTVV